MSSQENSSPDVSGFVETLLNAVERLQIPEYSKEYMREALRGEHPDNTIWKEYPLDPVSRKAVTAYDSAEYGFCEGNDMARLRIARQGDNVVIEVTFVLLY